MGKRIAIILAIVVALAGALFVGVKAEAIRPNMIFIPTGTQGVDISEHQGAIDAGALTDAGISFVYAKATEGSSHIDSQFQATCDAVTGGRIPLGAYHFFSFDSPGAQQAANFIAAATKNIATTRLIKEASPSRPSVKFTLFTIPVITKTPTGINHIPRLILRFVKGTKTDVSCPL